MLLRLTPWWFARQYNVQQDEFQRGWWWLRVRVGMEPIRFPEGKPYGFAITVKWQWTR